MYARVTTNDATNQITIMADTDALEEIKNAADNAAAEPLGMCYVNLCHPWTGGTYMLTFMRTPNRKEG